MGMLKRHEIQVLLKAGHAQAEVAQLTGASIRSVKRIAKEGDVAHVDDAAERLTRGIGRPSLVEDFRKPIADLLEQERDLKSVEVLRRMRLAGYTGHMPSWNWVSASMCAGPIGPRKKDRSRIWSAS